MPALGSAVPVDRHGVVLSGLLNDVARRPRQRQAPLGGALLLVPAQGGSVQSIPHVEVLASGRNLVQRSMLGNYAPAVAHDISASAPANSLGRDRWTNRQPNGPGSQQIEHLAEHF